jgi:hypothetical protein
MMYRLPKSIPLFGEHDVHPYIGHCCAMFVMDWLMYGINRPDGKKKAYVRLTADHDALDVANKVELFHVSSIVH